jgi:hypothetical protein
MPARDTLQGQMELQPWLLRYVLDLQVVIKPADCVPVIRRDVGLACLFELLRCDPSRQGHEAL